MLDGCSPRRTTRAAVAIAGVIFIVVNIVFFRSLMGRDQVHELRARALSQAHRIHELEQELEELKARPALASPSRARTIVAGMEEDPRLETMLEDAKAALTVCNQLNDELIIRLRKAAATDNVKLDDLLRGWNKMEDVDASPIGCRAELLTLRMQVGGLVPKERTDTLTAELAAERLQKGRIRESLKECATMLGAMPGTGSDGTNSDRVAGSAATSSKAFLKLASGETDAPTSLPTVAPTTREPEKRIHAKHSFALLRPAWLTAEEWAKMDESHQLAATELEAETAAKEEPTAERAAAVTPVPVKVALKEPKKIEPKSGGALSPVMRKYGVSTAVLVICHSRAEYLEKALDKVIETRPHEDLFPIFVSQDGEVDAVTDVIDTYRSRVKHLRHDNSVPVHTTRPKENPSYFKIARHYGWAIDQVFAQKNVDRLILLEEDIEVSVDFFHYMAGGAWLMDEDKSIWCVSGWNDNGKPEFVKDPKTLYRSDFFPGLGWMMKRDLWTEIGDRWPRESGYWDDWMRRPDVRRGRACIRPDISRTYTFGKKGASGGQFFDKFLSKIQLNTELVKFDELDLSYLTKVAYDANFRKAVFFAERVEAVQDLDYEQDKVRDVRLAYTTMKNFAATAKRIGIMTDEKAGVPRTGYQGVVTFWWGRHKRNRVMLVPETFG